MQDLKDLLIMSCVNWILINMTGFPSADTAVLNIVLGLILLIMIAFVVRQILVTLRSETPLVENENE